MREATAAGAGAAAPVAIIVVAVARIAADIVREGSRVIDVCATIVCVSVEATNLRRDSCFYMGR